MAESADSSKIEKLKALAKVLGLDAESLPLPEKFPPHTLALTHKRRRNYYITAADEDEKKEWVEMFKTCCRKIKGTRLRQNTHVFADQETNIEYCCQLITRCVFALLVSSFQ